MLEIFIHWLLLWLPSDSSLALKIYPEATFYGIYDRCVTIDFWNSLSPNTFSSAPWDQIISPYTSYRSRPLTPMELEKQSLRSTSLVCSDDLPF